MKHYVILGCCVLFIATVSATDYCAKSCQVSANNVIQHIGCNHNQKFSASSCPEDAELVPISGSLLNSILDYHNEKRNFIAGGGDKRHSPACHMATMQWDPELAYLAELNVKQCDAKYDNCHETDNYAYSGQNIALKWKDTPGGFEAPQIIAQLIEDWYNEVENSTQAAIDAFPLKEDKKMYHFALMMNERNIRIGCSAAIYYKATCEFIDLLNLLFVCNYAVNNVPGVATYEKCQRPATSCKTGTNPAYPNLCSTKEQYNVA